MAASGDLVFRAPPVGRTLAEQRDRWGRVNREAIDRFARGETDLCTDLVPADAVELSGRQVLDILRARFGTAVDLALDARWTDPAQPASVHPPELRSPVSAATDTHWMTAANVVGVNVRTVGSFFNVVKYALTLSATHDAIHLLPIWEPGVVGSLYGMSSWQINGEFRSPTLAETVPHLDTAARQLKASVHLLHLMGKAVGMDVIPHTDRFSEIVLANPHHFEWIRREDLSIVDHCADLHREVQERVFAFLQRAGSAVSDLEIPDSPGELFGAGFPEDRRNRLLFGDPDRREDRAARRAALARSVYLLGYEPAPATMAPPYRGLEVDPETVSIDADGHPWREYRFLQPGPMSRVFGPLTRYKLFERIDDNRGWEIDFDRPRHDTWRYVTERYGAVQRAFGFDFMRGDMSHVQMRPEGVPATPDETYDILGAVGGAIATGNDAPWFAYFAETFLAPPGTMAFGDEIDHLEASAADATLGDLQSVPVSGDEFLPRLRRYRDIGETRAVIPALTTMTGDKDDPRFDGYYRDGNEVRYFLALFITDMPSYTALNFECRDIHASPAPNEHYTKLYVFQERGGPKATAGPFVFGGNGHLFYRVTRMRLFAERWLPQWRGRPIRWLLPPDATAGTRTVAWTIETDGRPVCVVNTDTGSVAERLHVPLSVEEGPTPPRSPIVVFSTDESRECGAVGVELTPAPRGGWWLEVSRVAPGEGLVVFLA